MTGNDILTHKGAISHKQAIGKANKEYTLHKELIQNELSKAEKDFIKAIDKTSKKIIDKKKY